MFWGVWGGLGMRMGVAGGEDTVWDSQVLTQKGLRRHCPPLTLSSWGDDGLEPADLCELHPEGRGVEISWLLLASQ